MENSKEQLDYIEKMISTAKGNLSDGSKHFLLWGWLVLIAATINYYLLVFTKYENHWIAWPILMTLGGLIAIVFSIKDKKRKKVVTKLDSIMMYLWLGFIITLFVILGGMSTLGPLAIYPMLMALYGLGTFVSGAILEFKTLKVGAVASWVCASIAFYQVEFSNHLILLIAAIVFSYIIPGHLLAVKK